MKTSFYEDFEDPELEYEEESEIAAAVDVSIIGEDRVFRPVYINQDEQVIALTPDDAKRLHKFLDKAINFIESYQTRVIQ